MHCSPSLDDEDAIFTHSRYDYGKWARFRHCVTSVGLSMMKEIAAVAFDLNHVIFDANVGKCCT